MKRKKTRITMQRNIVFELPEEIVLNKDPRNLKPFWRIYPFREADQDWLIHTDIGYFHQSFITILNDIQLIECQVKKEVNIKIKSLNNHFYLLYILGDSVLYFKNEDGEKIEIEKSHYTAGYCPKGDYYMTLKPGNYTILYINPLNDWLLSTGRKFTELDPLYNMIETNHTEHEILPPGPISPKEEALLIRLRLSKYKSEMELSNTMWTINEALLYRCHQRLENHKNNIIPDRLDDLERIRAEIRAIVNNDTNPYIDEICLRLGLDIWEMKIEHKNKYQISLHQYKESVRLKEGRLLLKQGNTVRYVSIKLAYLTADYFSKQYFKYFGHLPSQANNYDDEDENGPEVDE